jgi:hypothetical protein
MSTHNCQIKIWQITTAMEFHILTFVSNHDFLYHRTHNIEGSNNCIFMMNHCSPMSLVTFLTMVPTSLCFDFANSMTCH